VKQFLFLLLTSLLTITVRADFWQSDTDNAEGEKNSAEIRPTHNPNKTAHPVIPTPAKPLPVCNKDLKVPPKREFHFDYLNHEMSPKEASSSKPWAGIKLAVETDAVTGSLGITLSINKLKDTKQEMFNLIRNYNVALAQTTERNGLRAVRSSYVGNTKTFTPFSSEVNNSPMPVTWTESNGLVNYLPIERAEVRFDYAPPKDDTGADVLLYVGMGGVEDPRDNRDNRAFIGLTFHTLKCQSKDKVMTVLALRPDEPSYEQATDILRGHGFVLRPTLGVPTNSNIVHHIQRANDTPEDEDYREPQ
jgi:hypothetical protein